MKNIKKFTKAKASIKFAICSKVFSCLVRISAHVPGMAEDIYHVVDVGLDTQKLRVNGSELTLNDVIQDLIYNGADSEVFRTVCREDGVRLATKLVKRLQRFYLEYRLLGVLAALDKYERIKKSI